MTAQGAFGTDFYDRSTRTIVGTMLWTGYRPVIKIGPKGALGSHVILPIHSAPRLGKSIPTVSKSSKTSTSFVSAGPEIMMANENLMLNGGQVIERILEKANENASFIHTFCHSILGLNVNTVNGIHGTSKNE